MILIRKFYDEAAGEGGAGAGADGGNNGGDNGANGSGEGEGASAAAAVVAEAPLFTADELKEMGYETVEAAKEGLRGLYQKSKVVDPTEAEKKKAAEIEHADFLKYAAENDFVNDEFKQYDSLKGSADRDLVFNKFAAEFKEDNPEISAEDLEEETKLAFATEFKLNSENVKEKARGEAKLAKEAKDLRSGSETAYTTAQSAYNDHKEVLKKGEGYAKTFKEVVNAIPDKLEIFKTTLKKDDTDEGEELAIEVELTKDERVAIEKQYNTPKTLRAYLDAEKEGKLDVFKANLNKKIISFIKSNREESIYADIATKVKGVAMRYGSDVGAGQPFAVVKGGSSADASGAVKTAKQAAIDSTRKASNF